MLFRHVLLFLGLCALTGAVTVTLVGRASAPARAAVSAAVPEERCSSVATEGSTRTSAGGGLVMGLSLDELSDQSERVLVGTVKTYQTCRDPADDQFITTVTIDADRHLKAPAGESVPPSLVTIDVPGGQIGNLIISASSSAEFSVGEQVLVFLRPLGGRWYVTEAFQGKFSVSSSGAVRQIGLSLAAFEEKVGQAIEGDLPASEDPLGSSVGVVAPAYALLGPDAPRWFAADIPVEYAMNASENKPAQLSVANIETAWTNAFNTWQNSAKSDISFSQLPDTTLDSDGLVCNGSNELTWNLLANSGDSVLAVAIVCTIDLPPTGDIDGDLQIVEGDIEFDLDDWGPDWRIGSGSCGSGLVDLETVALHEIGHVIGLDHPSNNSCVAGSNGECPVMDASYGGVQHSLCQDDANGAGFLYPPSVPTPTPTPKNPNGDTDGDTIINSSDPDDDNDGCPDVNENQTAVGSELSGGRRNPHNRWDYFNPSKDGLNRVDDILLVVAKYFVDSGNPLYTQQTDRTLLGPNPWNLGPPNGQHRVDDILHAVNQYFHDC